jgi:hypothetical protein
MIAARARDSRQHVRVDRVLRPAAVTEVLSRRELNRATLARRSSPTSLVDGEWPGTAGEIALGPADPH